MLGGLFMRIKIYFFGILLIATAIYLFAVAKQSNRSDDDRRSAKFAAWLALALGILICVIADAITIVPGH